MTEIERNLFDATLQVFNKAVDQGYGSYTAGDPEYDFYNAIRTNNEVWSAFRTHAMQNDLAKQLIDDKGILKPFKQWSNDVQTIVDHHVERWMRTEYDTAVLRAHQAADWQQFEREKDILPNLRWMPTTSPTPDQVHKVFWESKLTLPVNHSFWNYHKPGDRWNCKCYLESTDDNATPGGDIPSIKEKPDKGLDNNVGKTGELFSQSHPFVADAPKGTDKVVNRFLKEKQLHSKAIQYDVAKVYKNGGEVMVHPLVDKTKSDYKDIYTIANQFAKQGRKVNITPRLHYKSDEYKQIYKNLIGTRYERKCPDFEADGVFYEYESFVPPFKKRKISSMLQHGLKQSDHIIINNTHGAVDRFIKRHIQARIKFGIETKEVWVYEKGKIRLIYKNTELQ